jgi:hypothetical protein
MPDAFCRNQGNIPMRLAPAAIVAATLVVLLQATVASAALVYSQTRADGSFAASDRAMFGSGFRHADDFTVVSAATVRSVTWRGSYANGTTPPLPLSFKLTFYANDPTANGGNGLPNAGAVLSDTPVSFASVSDIKSVMTSGGTSLLEYQADLSAPLALTAGTRYWFSAMADTRNETNNDWRWAGGGGAVSQARQTSVAGNSPFEAATIAPLYYVLDDAAVVPEPAGLTLLGASAVALLARRRRAAAR